MIRLKGLTLCVLAAVLLATPLRADDPPKKLTAKERRELDAKRSELNAAYKKAYSAGKYSEALQSCSEALEVARQLYSKTDYPDGHYELATNLNDLAFLNQAQGKLADAETLHRDALDMRRKLFKGDHPAVATSLNNLGGLYNAQGKLTDAEPLYRAALDMRRKLFKNHPELATSLNNLAFVYWERGQLAAAEPLLKDSLEMYKQLFKGDNSDVADGLNNLAGLYEAQGKLTDAEPLYRAALDMRRKLFKGDHPDVATSLNNLAFVYRKRGKFADAETLHREALDMRRKLFSGDHPAVAMNLSHLASLYFAQSKFVDAEVFIKDALDMRRRLFKGDHPAVAQGLNDFAAVYRAQGKLANAEKLFKDALDMYRRLFKGDHPRVADGLNNLAAVYREQNKLAAAEDMHKDALEMIQRLITTYARQKSEGEALTFRATQTTVGPLLSVGRDLATATPTRDATTLYVAVWGAKGMLARVFELRQLQARAAATDPALKKELDQLTDARRRRVELLLLRPTQDPGTLRQRTADLDALDRTIAELNTTLPKRLPAVARTDKLDAATATDLQKALLPDVALVDYVRYIDSEFDNARPIGEKDKLTVRYLAFVVTRDKVAWVDLDTAAEIEPAVDAWRAGITGGKEIPPAMPAKVRALVWDKVRKAIPAGTTTVYICPDAHLCRVPFAALPGDKPGTVLLEDFALATVPHAPFLLDKLWPQDERKNPPADALVVGGVQYDAKPTAPAPKGDAVVSRGDPLVKEGAKLVWEPLKGTVGEVSGIAKAAERKKIAATRIEGDKATSAAVLAALPKAKYAHFATHGFFADASFRGLFDEKDFEKSLRGERIGRAVNSPLVMTGLVLAGANNPDAPGRGILTGEQLVDLDLSGLHLAVLSACETGLGDVAGGEGTFGLQRAFHYAGTTNVVASLWRVPDAPTAALMNLFYRNLWDKNLSPMEALRQAQLELYKNPQRVGEWAAGFRGPGFEEVDAPKVEVKAPKDGTAPAQWWAAFTLSGPGR